MCQKTFDVVGLDTQRTAYEVEQYLSGLPYVENVTVDLITDSVVIQYDESTVSEDRVMDEIEHSGCKPSDRMNGVIDRLKVRLGGI